MLLLRWLATLVGIPVALSAPEPSLGEVGGDPIPPWPK